MELKTSCPFVKMCGNSYQSSKFYFLDIFLIWHEVFSMCVINVLWLHGWISVSNAWAILRARPHVLQALPRIIGGGECGEIVFVDELFEAKVLSFMCLDPHSSI